MPETRGPPSSIPLNPEAMSWCHLHSQTNLPGQIRALLGSGALSFTACLNPIKMGEPGKGPRSVSGSGLEDTQPALPSLAGINSDLC